jgi:cell division protein ZapA
MAEDIEIEIEIFGQMFRVAAGDASEDYIHRLASYVDERMKSVAEMTKSVSFNRMAVLTALNIADDLLKLQERYEAASQALSAKTDDLLGLLDQHVSDQEPSD